MSRGMQHRGHSYTSFRLVHFVKDTVRKTLWVTPPDVFGRVTPGIEQRIFGQRIPHADDFLHKLRAQSRPPGLVPIGRCRNIGFDFGGELDTPPHLAWRARRRLFISSIDTADAGASRSAASRDSTRDSSPGPSGASSNSNARRMSSCRCSNVKVGSSRRTSLKLIRGT
jgi:hypothetical protein